MSSVRPKLRPLPTVRQGQSLNIITGVSFTAERRWRPRSPSPAAGQRSAGLAAQGQKTSFRILVGIYCHNIPTCTPRRGYHWVTEVAKTANKAEKAKKCIKCLSHSAPYKPYGVGTREHFFGSKSKKTKRFMIFDTKKEGGHFSTPPPSPHPPPLPQNLKKVGFKWGGLRGSGPKTHWGMCLLGKIMILQGVKLTIQHFGVGYANRPKKAKTGGYVAFSPIYACLALI